MIQMGNMRPEDVTILVALIAGAVSLLTITLSKEQKVSEFRQAWIDALREDLATFLSCARAFARAMDARNSHGIETDDPGKKPFTSEKLGEIRSKAVEAYYRIKLRLNPEEEAHKELLRLLWQAIVDQNAVLESNALPRINVLGSIDRAADFASPVLKTEWRRVKEGERPYRVARNAAIIVVILSLVSIAIVSL
jgi:hypothetical protein